MDNGQVRTWGAITISLIVVLGYLMAIFTLVGMGHGLTANVARLLDILFGALTIAFGNVTMYWVGSSSSSQAKDETIAHSTPLPKP